MKYGFKTLGLFLILFSSLFLQNVFSQMTQETPFDPTELINSIIDQNTGLPQGIEEQVSIEQIPSIPKPNETISIQITDYATDLNKAVINWSLDGKSLLSQTGATSLQFQAPASGKTSTLIITIKKENGGIISKKIVITPADVDLIYEAQTYTPPFYKGKKIFTSESVIKFIAIPSFVTSNNTKIPASSLVYTWKINGTAQQTASGYGKNIFTTKGSLIERPSQVTVEVSAINSTLKASQTLNFLSITPEVVLYENNPILGVVYEKAIQGSFILDRPQVDFEAVPYFFSGDYKDSPILSYNWWINGTKITSKAPNENYLVLRNDKNEEGTAVISLSADHLTNILQTTQASLELNFKKVENEPNAQTSL